MTETIIPLTQDNIPDDIEGMPKPLTPEGSVTIENPAAPVDLDESIMPPATTTEIYPETSNEPV